MRIDLRSDTVTQPTSEMLETMMRANVGDDVYGEDPSINALQEKAATMFGKEAALFCPSGTMCNQIAIRISTRPQDQVMCDQRAHIYLYEGGGIAANSLATVRLIEGNRGRLTAQQVEANINADDPHFPRTSLVALENTSNKGGGSCYELSEIEAISQVCRKFGLRLHLDGARIFNALVKTGQDPQTLGQYFDTISFCLSKGLGAPVGSLLVGSKTDIKEALRVRKVMGGGMRQAGFLAAAGLYALDHHIDRLAEDHRRAGILAEAISQLSWVEDLMPVETNLVAFKPDPNYITFDSLYQKLRELHIYGSNFGYGYIRFVTHLDITDDMISQVITTLKQI